MIYDTRCVYLHISMYNDSDISGCKYDDLDDYIYHSYSISCIYIHLDMEIYQSVYADSFGCTSPHHLASKSSLVY